jgi:hypothetical protein
MTVPTDETLPLRVCDLCGGVDDHPRHVIAGAMTDVFPRVGDDIVDRVLTTAPEQDRGRLLRELLDTSSSDRHLQCCAEAGCPQENPAMRCDVLIANAGGVIGDDLRGHLDELRTQLITTDTPQEG